jgi:SNF2 family DNA or RNA helicase
MKLNGTVTYLPPKEKHSNKVSSTHTPKVTFGTWSIQCAPHVAIRLKNVFAKISKTQFGTLQVSATPENSRDLQWFMTRYPMEIGSDAEILERLGTQHLEREALVDRLLKSKVSQGTFAMKVVPRDYQIHAAELWQAVLGLLLADSIGSGKTITAITGLMLPGRLPALVACDTHLTTQWKEQLERCTDLVVHLLHTTSLPITKENSPTSS